MPVVSKYLLQSSETVNKIVLNKTAAGVLMQIGTRRKHVPCTTHCPVQAINDRRLSIVQEHCRLLALS